MLNFRSPIVQQNFGYLMEEQPDFKSMTPEEMTAYHREHLAKQREKEAMMTPEERAAKFREGQLYYQELAERQKQEELYRQQQEQMMYQQQQMAMQQQYYQQPVNNQYCANPYLAYQQQQMMQQQYYQQPVNNQYQQQPYYYTAPGYNGGYNQQPVNNQYYGGAYYQPQQYSNSYYSYLEYQQQQAAYRQQQEIYANQIKMQRRLDEIALKYLGHDPEEIKEYLENKYNPKPQNNDQEDYSIVSKCKYVITCYRGDEEVYCSYDPETDDYERESYEESYTYYDMVKPTLARVNYLEAMQNYERNYVNPNYERALKHIEEERNKLVDPNCNLHEFLKNGYKLYVEALEMKTREQQNQLNKLFNKRKFESTIGIRGNGDTGGSIDFNRVFNSTSVDDYEVSLPDRLRTEYFARKRAFIEKCVERCVGGGGS